jgi:BTB/POZ domain
MEVESLHRLILDNKYDEVKSLLEANRFCANYNITRLPDEPEAPDADDTKYYIRPSRLPPDAPVISTLHCAVVNYVNVHRDADPSPDAKKIIELLIEYGADPTRDDINMDIIQSRNVLYQIWGDVTPLKLLTSMTKPTESTIHQSNAKDVSVLEKMLKAAETKWKEDHSGSISVPETTFHVLANLRGAKEMVTMAFDCSDGEQVTAHPDILSWGSPFFANFFNGPWTDAYPDRCWKTEYSSFVINIILDYLYTGTVNQAVLREHCMSVYVASSEFQFQGLHQLARTTIIECLSASTIKDAMELAHLYKDDTILTLCINYIDDHWQAVLIQPSFAALSVENPDLWKEIYISFLPGYTYESYVPRKRRKTAHDDRDEKKEAM